MKNIYASLDENYVTFENKIIKTIIDHDGETIDSWMEHLE